MLGVFFSVQIKESRAPRDNCSGWVLVDWLPILICSLGRSLVGPSNRPFNSSGSKVTARRLPLHKWQLSCPLVSSSLFFLFVPFVFGGFCSVYIKFIVIYFCPRKTKTKDLKDCDAFSHSRWGWFHWTNVSCVATCEGSPEKREVERLELNKRPSHNSRGSTSSWAVTFRIGSNTGALWPCTAKKCKVCFWREISHEKHMLCSAACSNNPPLSFFPLFLSDSRAWMVNEFCLLRSASPPCLQTPNASASQFLLLSPLTQTMGRYATHRRSSSLLHSHRLCLVSQADSLDSIGSRFLSTGTSCGLKGSLGSDTNHFLSFTMNWK